MINKRVIDNIRKTNEKVASLLEQLGTISEKQLQEILAEIEKVKLEKIRQNTETQRELDSLKQSEKKIKKSNEKVLKKKESIEKSIDILADGVGDGFKKVKTISDAADKLIEKTLQVKKDAMSVMSVFKKKEIINNYSFTFTKSSLINSKGVVFQNTIIKNINIGPQLLKSSQSSENYDAEKYDVESEQLKVLKSISNKLNFIQPTGDVNIPEKKEEKSSFNWKSLLFGAGTGGGLMAAAKTFGSKAFGAAKTTGKLGGKVLGKMFAPANAIMSGFEIKDRINETNKLLEKYKGSKEAEDAAIVGNIIGNFGSLVQGIGGFVPGFSIPLQAFGYGVSKIGDEGKNVSKDLYEKKLKEQQEFLDNPTASLKVKSFSDISITGDYRKMNGASLNTVAGIKTQEATNEYNAINDLIKNNENATLSALNGKRKGLVLPKIERTEKINVQEIKDKKTGKIIKDLPKRLPSNVTFESKGKVGSMTTLAGSLGGFGGQIRSEFNVMRNLFGTGEKVHGGVDIAVAEGTPIYAPIGGTITNKTNRPKNGKPGIKSGYGLYVLMDADNGYQAIYGHLSRHIPKSGRVEKGDLIGYSGNTGGSTGPHIHLQVAKKGKDIFKDYINPLEWLNAIRDENNGTTQAVSTTTTSNLPLMPNKIDFTHLNDAYNAGKEAGKQISMMHKKAQQ